MLSNQQKRDSYQAALLFAYHVSQAQKILEDPEMGIGLADIKRNAKSKVARELAEVMLEDLENIELKWHTIWNIPELIWNHIEIMKEEEGNILQGNIYPKFGKPTTQYLHDPDCSCKER